MRFPCLLQGPVLTLVFAPMIVRDFALSGAVAYWSVVTVGAICLVSLATVAHDLLERPGIRVGKTLMAAMRGSRFFGAYLGAGQDQSASLVGQARDQVDA